MLCGLVGARQVFRGRYGDVYVGAVGGASRQAAGALLPTVLPGLRRTLLLAATDPWQHRRRLADARRRVGSDAILWLGVHLGGTAVAAQVGLKLLHRLGAVEAAG